MKIVLVIGAVSFGGAERVITNLANYLVDNGDEVTLITIKQKKEIPYKLNDNINFINGLNRKNPFSEIFLLRKNIKRISPDVVLSFLTQINIATLVATIGLKIPVVVSERNDPQRVPHQKIRRYLRTVVYPLAKGYVFQTKEAKEYFSTVIQKKSKIIPNPLFINESVHKECKKKEIVTVGRLVTQKNHEMTINAFSNICDKYPDYKLLIYGEGELEHILKESVQKKNLNSRIVFKGTSSSLHDDIKNSQIFVLSSYYEGMPNALMEAMGLGLACISTDTPSGGAAFLINHEKNGLLVPVNDVDKMSSSIEKIIRDDEFRNNISDEAQKIKDKLSPERINREWRNYLEEMSVNKYRSEGKV